MKIRTLKCSISFFRPNQLWGMVKAHFQRPQLQHPITTPQQLAKLVNEAVSAPWHISITHLNLRLILSFFLPFLEPDIITNVWFIVSLLCILLSALHSHSLSMFSSSVMSIKPDIPECFSLHGWYNADGANQSFQAHSTSGPSEMTGGFNCAELHSIYDSNNHAHQIQQHIIPCLSDSCM